MFADRIARLRHEVGSLRRRLCERRVLIAQIEIVIMNERLGDEKVERFVAVDRRAHLRRHDERVDDRGDDRSARRRPFHFCTAREHDTKRGELQHRDGDEREVRVGGLEEPPDNERECIARNVEREIAQQSLAAKRDQRKRNERGDEQNDRQRHRSNASTCRIVRGGRCGSTLTCIVFASGGSAKRTAPSTHPSYPYARMRPAAWRGRRFVERHHSSRRANPQSTTSPTCNSRSPRWPMSVCRFRFAPFESERIKECASCGTSKSCVWPGRIAQYKYTRSVAARP